jgi:hypothetical protein
LRETTEGRITACDALIVRSFAELHHISTTIDYRLWITWRMEVNAMTVKPPAPLSEFDRALRAIVKVPKSDMLKMERKEKRKPQASKRKGK